MLTDAEIQTLIESIRQEWRQWLVQEGKDLSKADEWEQAECRVKGWKTVADIGWERDKLDALSEYFKIDFDTLRRLKAEEGQLLDLKFFSEAPEEQREPLLHLSLELEQLVDSMEKKWEQAGGPAKYFQQQLEKSRQAQAGAQKIPGSPILPKSKYR